MMTMTITTKRMMTTMYKLANSFGG
jgi:hypothetical protein